MSFAEFCFKVNKDEEDGLVYLSDFVKCYQDLFENRDAFECGKNVYLSITIKDLPDRELKDLSQTLSGRIFQNYFISKTEYQDAQRKKEKSASRMCKQKKTRNYSEEDKRRTDRIQISFRVSAKVSDRLENLCFKFGMNKKQLLSYLIMHQSDAGIFPEADKKKESVKLADLSDEMKKATRLLQIGTFFNLYKDASDYLNQIAYRVNRCEDVDQVAIREMVDRFHRAEDALDALPFDSSNKCMAKDAYESKMLHLIYNCMVTNPKNIIQLKDNHFNMENVEIMDKSVTFNLYQKINFEKEMMKNVSN